MKHDLRFWTVFGLAAMIFMCGCEKSPFEPSLESLVAPLSLAKSSAPPAYVSSWGSYGSGEGQFKNPNGVAMADNGDVYVSDYYNHRIQKFTNDGLYVTSWGSYGTGQGQFRVPFGLAVDHDDFIYVADYTNHRIQKFTSAGLFVRTFGGYGTGNGQFRYPRGVAVDNQGHVYVADYSNHRLQVFSGDGVFLAKWGSLGSGNGQFHSPVDAVVDSDGQIYVVDCGNHRMQVFDPAGQWMSSWGEQGSGEGQFGNPAGAAIDGDQKVYVADFDNNRVQVFSQQEPPLEASIDFDPDTFNRSSGGRWVTVYIELEDGYDVSEIVLSTVTLDSVGAVEKFRDVGDHDADSVPDLMVKFDRARISAHLQPGDEVEVTVSGELREGRLFIGRDLIRIIG